MKALFLGHFAATVAPRILAKVQTPLETTILDDEGDAAQLAPLLADAEIVVGHIWRAGFPPAPRLRLLQSVAAGLDLLDTEAVPKGVTICNVFGHEPAIAEYVIMTMLALTHRLFESVTAFRAGSWVASPQFGGGAPHGEVSGRAIGIIGYGRIGREVAERAAGLKCRVLAANRSPVTDPAPAETVLRHGLSLWRCRRRCCCSRCGGRSCNLGLYGVPAALLPASLRLLPLSGLPVVDAPRN
jgi:phosphoglycerate dehydrogenase-like enzyme